MIGKIVEVVDYPGEDFRVVQALSSGPGQDFGAYLGSLAELGQGETLVEVTRVSPQSWSDGWIRWCVVLEQGDRPKVTLV